MGRVVQPAICGSSRAYGACRGEMRRMPGGSRFKCIECGQEREFERQASAGPVSQGGGDKLSASDRRHSQEWP